MMRRGMKWIMFFAVCMVGIFGGLREVHASEPAYLVQNPPVVSDYTELPTMGADGAAHISWWTGIDTQDENYPKVSYEIEVATNQEFTGAQKFTTTETALAIPKTFFCANGGTYFVRVRTCVNATTDAPAYSAWSETDEYVFVAINQENFPGLYKVLLNGGQYNSENGIENEIYDTNADGWLDPKEIDTLTSIHTMNVTKKKNGKNTTVKATNVSSVKGIEYLKNLSMLSLERYSGKKMDLSNNVVTYVNLNAVKAKQFTLIAPDATHIYVEADDDVKMSKLDLSKCNAAVDMSAYGNKGTKTLKLPKTKTNLKVLSISEWNTKTIDVNAYKNLQQLYIYDCGMKKVKVNKCKDLRYIYFYFCEQIKSLNLKSNKKLRGADFYQSPGLTKKTVKRPKNGKYTWNKGKWWYETAKYQDDMNSLVQ